MNTKVRTAISVVPLLAIFGVIFFKVYSRSHAPVEKEQKTPTTLHEAHAELERVFPAEEIKKIDAMKSEDEMIEYHFGMGMGIRNSWGLWGGSPLSRHMRELGFTHSDDKSGVILETFWCKRHGKPFRLKERAAEYAAYWEAARKAEEDEIKAEEDEIKRVEAAKQKMRTIMMGLEFDAKRATTVKMPDRVDRSIRARFLAPLPNGVFIAVRKITGFGDDEYVTEPYFFSSEDRIIHKVNVPELQAISSCVHAGRTVWICGVSGGSKALLGISPAERVSLDLPKKDEVPQLGVHGESVLAVYSKSVYTFADGGWKILYDGDIAIPRSGPPPQLIGDHLYLRDEGRGENKKRLWWLKIDSAPSLVSLDDDVGVIGSHGPRWENSFSYAVSQSGNLWATVGEGYARKSVLRRTKDGAYSIAIMNNSVRFTPELFGSEEMDQGISISAVSCLKDDSVLLVGDAGLFRIKGQSLIQELAFENTQQEIPVNEGKNIYDWRWKPSKVAILGDDSYFISGAFGGVYLLQKEQSNEWSFDSLDEELGDPVTW